MAVMITEDHTGTKLDVLDFTPTSSGNRVLSQTEIQFLEWLKIGNVIQVKQCLKEGGIDLNYVDCNDDTALQIAVANDSKEIVELLLRCGADIGNSMLQAVSKGSLECLDILTDYDKAAISSNQQQGSVDLSRSLTPLILAAQNNNYEMVKLLISRGYTIQRPDVHPNSCCCEECQNLGGRLGKALLKLNTYKALASPVYLSLSYLLRDLKETEKLRTSGDPIIQAFLLHRQLEELSGKEYEFRKEYQELSKQCERFSVALFDECHDMTDIETLMTVPVITDFDYVEVTAESREAKKLSMLNFAIKCRNEKFVTHAYSQLLLNSVVYRGLHNWEERSEVTKVIFVAVYIVLFPFWALIYWISPTCLLARYLSIPLIKFLSHTMSFCLFLFLLTLSALKDEFNPGWYEALTVNDVIIGLWVAGLVISELKEVIREGQKRYLAQWWNFVTLLMLFWFVVGGIIWFAGFLVLGGSKTQAIHIARETSNLQENTGYQLILLSNSFFAFGYLNCFLHISIALQVNATVGPMHLSLIKMVKDVLKFMFLFSMVFVAFGLSIKKVYSPYVLTQAASVSPNNTQTSSSYDFFIMEGSFRQLFWALFGFANLSSFSTNEDFQMTENTGKLLFAFYNFSAVLVGLNMLIAMMMNTFQQVTRCEVPPNPQVAMDQVDTQKRVRIIRKLIRRYLIRLERTKTTDS